MPRRTPIANTMVEIANSRKQSSLSGIGRKNIPSRPSTLRPQVTCRQLVRPAEPRAAPPVLPIPQVAAVAPENPATAGDSALSPTLEDFEFENMREENGDGGKWGRELFS